MNTRLQKGILFLMLTLVYHQLSAQNETPKGKRDRRFSYSYSVSFEQGTMLGNGTTIGDKLAHRAYYNGVDVHMGFNINDHKDIYNQVYRLPVLGLGWYTSTFHASDIGKPNALYFYFNMPLRFERSKKFTLSYTGAFGISYNFNPYDSIENPGDVFIGSYENCYLNLSMLFNYHISPKVILYGSIGFKHFSNGSFQLPNYGINLVPLAVGIKYKPSGFKPFEGETDIPHYIRHNEFNFSVMAASKNYVAGNPNYLKAGLSMNWLRAFNYKYKAGLGLDVFYAAKTGKRTNSESTFSNSVSFAIAGSWEWNINRHLYIPIAFGVYLKRNQDNGERDPFYERVGMRYRLKNGIFTGVTIKAHKGVADVFEWTLGYTLRHDPNRY
jgi:hypothetical protein